MRGWPLGHAPPFRLLALTLGVHCMSFNDGKDVYARLYRLALDGDVGAALALEREAERRDDKAALCLALVVGLGVEVCAVHDEVVLVSVGASKLRVVRAVIDRVGLSLLGAKNLVESAPVVVLTRASAERVGELRAALEEVGGVVVLQSSAHREVGERVGGLVASLSGAEQVRVIEQVLQTRLRRAGVADVSALVGAMPREVRAVAAPVLKALCGGEGVLGRAEMGVEGVRLSLQLDDPRGLTAVGGALGGLLTGGERALWVGLLGSVGPGLVEGALALLDKALRDADTNVQRAAVNVLGQLGELAAGLLERAAHVSDVLVRRRAFEALAKLDGVEIRALVRGLFDIEHNIRRVVVGALEVRGWEPTNDAERAAYLLACEQWEALEAGGQAAVAALDNALDEPDWRIRERVTEVLCKMSGDDVDAALARALNNEDRTVRLSAVRGLDGRNSEAVTRALVGALADEYCDVRHTAAPLLNKRAWVAEDARQAMLYALATRRWGRLADMGPPAVEVLAIGMHDWNPEVRCEAVRALGKIQTPESITLLVDALSDADTQVRLSAAFALDILGWSPSTTQDRAEYLLASHRWSRLTELGFSALPTLRDAFSAHDDTSQHTLTKSLAALGPPGTALLIGALDHPYARVRARIATLLGELHIHDAIPALQTAAAHDVSAQVRAAAAKALDVMASNPS